MTLGQSHALFFFQLFSHQCKMGLTPSSPGTEGPMESVRGYDSDHPSSEGVCQAEPPTQAWSVHELQDTGIGGAPSDPATPEDPESPRRNQEGKEGNDKCPV